MASLIRNALSKVLDSPLGLLPVRVLRGPAKGARWTLGPFSAYWRKGGGEDDVAAAFEHLPAGTKGMVFWDIGAHYGIHTIAAARLAGENGQAVAFEPDPAAFKRLSLHVRRNRLDTVVLFRAAASNANGAASLYLPRGSQGSANSFLKFHAHDDMVGYPAVSVRTLTLDSLVEAGRIRAPDLIKVDCQGHGGKALAGAARTIAKARPLICFSNHSTDEFEQTRAVLEPLRYEPIKLDGSPLEWIEWGYHPVLVVPAA